MSISSTRESFNNICNQDVSGGGLFFFFKSTPSAILVVDTESCLYYTGVSLEEWKQALV